VNARGRRDLPSRDCRCNRLLCHLSLKATAATAGAAATSRIDYRFLLLRASEGFQLAYRLFGFGFGADVCVHRMVLSNFQGSSWNCPGLATLNRSQFEGRPLADSEKRFRRIADPDPINPKEPSPCPPRPITPTSTTNPVEGVGTPAVG
jgi:hypothetical protein